MIWSTLEAVMLTHAARVNSWSGISPLLSGTSM
jgi:hypothetical protein